VRATEMAIDCQPENSNQGIVIIEILITDDRLLVSERVW